MKAAIAPATLEFAVEPSPFEFGLDEVPTDAVIDSIQEARQPDIQRVKFHADRPTPDDWPEFD
jgi:hypothetical protein